MAAVEKWRAGELSIGNLLVLVVVVVAGVQSMNKVVRKQNRS